MPARPQTSTATGSTTIISRAPAHAHQGSLSGKLLAWGRSQLKLPSRREQRGKHHRRARHTTSEMGCNQRLASPNCGLFFPLPRHANVQRHGRREHQRGQIDLGVRTSRPFRLLEFCRLKGWPRSALESGHINGRGGATHWQILMRPAEPLT